MGYNEDIDLSFENKKVTFDKVDESFFFFDLEGFLVVEETKNFNYNSDTVLSYRVAEDVPGQVLKIVPT